MFNILNSRTETRKFSPWMCKFLATMSAVPRSFPTMLEVPSYLLESMRLRFAVLETIGLRIATSFRRPAFAHIRTGKA
jgi:hypothetical protein